MIGQSCEQFKAGWKSIDDDEPCAGHSIEMHTRLVLWQKSCQKNVKNSNKVIKM